MFTTADMGTIPDVHNRRHGDKSLMFTTEDMGTLPDVHNSRHGDIT